MRQEFFAAACSKDIQFDAGIGSGIDIQAKLAIVACYDGLEIAGFWEGPVKTIRFFGGRRPAEKAIKSLKIGAMCAIRQGIAAAADMIALSERTVFSLIRSPQSIQIYAGHSVPATAVRNTNP